MCVCEAVCRTQTPSQSGMQAACTAAAPSLQGMHWVCCPKCCCPEMCVCLAPTRPPVCCGVLCHAVSHLLLPAQVQVHLAARNPEQEKLEAEKRAEEMARLRCVCVPHTPACLDTRPVLACPCLCVCVCACVVTVVKHGKVAAETGIHGIEKCVCVFVCACVCVEKCVCVCVGMW